MHTRRADAQAAGFIKGPPSLAPSGGGGAVSLQERPSQNPWSIAPASTRNSGVVSDSAAARCRAEFQPRC